MLQNELLFLLWRLVLVLCSLKAIQMLKVMKLRKLPLCSTPFGNIIISKTQVFVQGFTTLVCIMYNAKDTHALAGRATEGNDQLVWMKKFSLDLSFYIYSCCLNKI